MLIIVRNTSAKEVDIQAAQTYEIYEDGQELRPKHVGAIINILKPACYLMHQ